jgi:hypothetical protein
MDIVTYGLYSVSDTYFSDYTSEWFCDNKSENRPYFISFIDKQGVIWLIPLSSQVQSYKNKIECDEQKYGNCLYYHIGKIYGSERAFLIGNMFPVSENYIKKPYTYSGEHYIVKDEQLIKEIKKRATKFLLLVEQGKLKPHVNILSIRNDLLK